MERYPEDKLIEQEYRALENERIIAQITEKGTAGAALQMMNKMNWMMILSLTKKCG